MKHSMFFCAIALTCSLSSCQMLREVNESTRSIQRNRMAVERSTEAIERNIEALNKVTNNIENMEHS